ncbi:MAG: glycoside hydrolase [Planctomycetaceae bacterium]|jgi:hypothetical protein|nr:glycoside hydrolase [Planctomycetaceae bacterium]
MKKIFVLQIFVFIIFAALVSVSVLIAETENLPPGVVISQSPDFATTYVGSPSIAILPDGTYVASHDWFGNNASLHLTFIFVSKDKGATWTKTAQFPFHWANLFVHKGDLYLLGVIKETYKVSPAFSHFAIRRSQDGGKTWTEPVDSKTGLLRTDGIYHTAPCPVVIHNGRIWRAMERILSQKEREQLKISSQNFGTQFQALMTSAPVDADILNAESWTISEPFLYDRENWIGDGFLEGNAVLSPEKKILNILRAAPVGLDKAIILNCSENGKNLTSRGKASQMDFPGGAVKFTIRFDPQSKRYWSLTTKQNDPPAFRNYLVLISSQDLIHWNIETVLLRHYDENNIVFVSRTAWDGSHNAHDANYMTFHRIENFRNKTTKDDAPWLGQLKPVEKRPAEDFKIFETTDFIVRGTHTEIGTFDNHQKAFVNRNYVWLNVPEQFQGWKFTRQNAGGKPLEEINICAKKDATFYLLTSRHTAYNHLKLIPSEIRYSDTNKSRVRIYERPIKKGEQIQLPQWGFSGGILLFKE